MLSVAGGGQHLRYEYVIIPSGGWYGPVDEHGKSRRDVYMKRKDV